MDRDSVTDAGILLGRASYPEPVNSTDGGKEFFIDYSLTRPGDVGEFDGLPPSIYVHNPDNPHWGDIWIKNKRSKDDIGHMLHAIAALPGCTDDATEEMSAELDYLEEAYGEWCRRVEDDDWRIATVDEEWNVYFPNEDLAFYIQILGAECKSMLAIRLYGRAEAGPLDCGNGVDYFDEEWGLKNDYHQIQRSYHEAAASLAFMRGHHELGNAMLEGLAWRIDKILDAMDSDPGYKGPHEQDVAELIVVSATSGLPLTWREVRFLHDRIEEAHAGYLADHMIPHYNVFEPDTPDGEYAYNPSSGGFFWRVLGTVLGTCGSPYVNSTSKPLLDCDMVKAWGN